MSNLSPTDDPSALSDAQRARIKAELVPGERLLWSSVGTFSPNGGCGPKTLSVTALGFLAASTILFVHFFRLPALNGKESDSVLIAAVLTGLVGFLIVVAIISTFWSRKKYDNILVGCLYVLTDRRAILWRPDAGPGTEVISLVPGQVQNISRVEKTDNSGDLLFWAGLPGNFVDQGEPVMWDRPRFIGVPNIRQVEDMARRVLLPDFLQTNPS